MFTIDENVHLERIRNDEFYINSVVLLHTDCPNGIMTFSLVESYLDDHICLGCNEILSVDIAKVEKMRTLFPMME